MNKVKILHTADVHLGSDPQFGGSRRGLEVMGTFRRILELAAREGVEIILIAGDLLEGSGVAPDVIAAVKEYLGLFPGQVFISPGNHDYVALDSPYLDGDWPDNVTIFQGAFQRVDLPQLRVSVLGAGFTGTYQEEPLLRPVQPDPDWIHLGVVHGELTAPGGISRYHAISPEDIAASGLDYLALGHIHLRTKPVRAGSTTYAYPGCPDGRGFDETGQKGVYLGEVSKGRADLRFVPTSSRIYAEVTVDISDLSGQAAIRQAVRERLQDLFGDAHPDHFYRITLTGSLPPEQGLAWPLLQSALAEDVHFVRLIDDTSPAADLAQLAAELTLKGIFVRRMLAELDGVPEGAKRLELQKALTFGIRAFDGKVLTYED